MHPIRRAELQRALAEATSAVYTAECLLRRARALNEAHALGITLPGELQLLDALAAMARQQQALADHPEQPH